MAIICWLASRVVHLNLGHFAIKTNDFYYVV